MRVFHERKQNRSSLPIRVYSRDYMIKYPHHWHEDLEIICVTEGTFDYGIRGEVITLGKGDVLVIGPGEVHFCPEQGSYFKFELIIAGMEFFEEMLPELNILKLLSKLNHNTVKITCEANPFVHSELISYIKRIVDEYGKKDDAYAVAIKSCLFAILVCVIRNMDTNEFLLYKDANFLKQREKITDVLRFVEKNFTGDLTLEKVAGVGKLSKFHFSRLFKECTGVTFLSYLNNIRITKAQHALTDLDRNISDIAFDCGFKSIESFNRTFKLIAGCTPSEYRKKDGNKKK